jgi:hypothetical protein
MHLLKLCFVVRHTIVISCIIDRLWMTDVIMAKFRDLQ